MTNDNSSGGEQIPLQMVDLDDIKGLGKLEYQMCNSDATGQPLVAYKRFGADIIRFPAGGKVGLHTHEGDHILIVQSGSGWLTYYDKMYELTLATVYLVAGQVPHAIEASMYEELTLLAIGNQHYPVDSEARLDVV